LEVAEEDADVQCPPIPSTLPLVVAGGTLPAHATAAFLRAPRTDVGDHGTGIFVEVDRLDHRRPVDTEGTAPYLYSEHAILLA